MHLYTRTLNITGGPFDHRGCQRAGCPECVVRAVHGSVANDVRAEFVVPQGVVQVDVDDPRNGVVKARSVVDVDELDFEEVKQRVRVHATVMNDLGHTCVLE